MIGIIDYGMGNLKSLHNALEYLGEPARIIASRQEIEEADRLILPGVGSYAKASQNLNDLGLLAPLLGSIAAGKPILGICLGMQLLSTSGSEHKRAGGLGAIPGEVVELDVRPTLRLPHMGWNTISLRRDHPVFASISKNVDFYFVHSFHFLASDPAAVLATTSYGKDFTSAVASQNVVGVQFHPEKSQRNGLKILENFSSWNGQC